MSKLEAWPITAFQEAVRARDDDRIIQLMHELDRLGCWHQAIAQFLSVSGQGIGADLLMFWNRHGFQVAGSLRGNPILLDVLRHHLPPYSGPPLTLYRGELEARHLAEVYGIAWTSQPERAEAFARRRDSWEGRGIVLKIDATPEMILAALNNHAFYVGPTKDAFFAGEGEYLVDTRIIGGVTVVPTERKIAL